MLRMIVGIAWGALCCAPMMAATIHVNAGLAGGSNDGTSWSNAFRGRLGLASALAVAQSGDEVWVASGVYAPGAAGASRSVTFAVPDGVQLLGGFAGGESDPVLRNLAVNVVVLTGDLNANDGGGAPGADNVIHVVRLTNCGATTLIDGVIIERGDGNGPGATNDFGGGVAIEGGAPVILRCTVRMCEASTGGGGLWITAASPSLSDCRFEGNTCGGTGGAVFHTAGSAAQFERCVFTNNRGGRGAGMFSGRGATISSATVIDCEFINNGGNISSGNGPGIFEEKGTSVIRRCRFVGNRTGSSGGGIHLSNSAALVDSCLFVDNEGNFDGGDGIYAENFGGGVSNRSVVVNCIFTGHTGPSSFLGGFGAVFVNATAKLDAINCTIANNGRPGVGTPPIVVTGSGQATFTNCVVWGNVWSGSGTQAAQVLGGSSATFTNCLMQGWNGTLAGSGNFSADPMFADSFGSDDVRGTTDDDFRLLAGSPAIDSGVSAAVPVSVTADFDGNARIVDGNGDEIAVVDRGAFEFAPPPPPECIADANQDGATDAADLSVLLGQFGASVPAGTGTDFNGDGVVDGADLSVLLGGFGCGE